MRNSKLLILLFILLLPSTITFAQSPFFRPMQIDREIDNLRAKVLYQDKAGFIWTGTDQGLYRYDGFLFEKTKLDTCNIKSPVSAIAENHAGKLMVGLENGTILIKEKDKFKKIDCPAKNQISKILDYKGKSLWVATYGQGVFYKTNNVWHRLAGIPDPYIYTIVEHPSGLLLAGTDLGLLVIDPRKNQINYWVYDALSGLPDNLVRDIFCEPSGTVWLGFQEAGICKFDLKNGIFTVPEQTKNWKYGPVNCLAMLESGCWIGLDGNGIIDFEFKGDKRVRQFNRTNGFAYTKISTLLRDKEGNVWVGAENKLLFSSGEKIEIIPSAGTVKMDSIQAITTDQFGYIWFSNRNGLFRYDRTKPEEKSVEKFLKAPQYKNLHIVSLYEDDSGFLWIGTFDNGLYRLNILSGEVERYGEKQGLRNANVISINGNKDQLWLATLGGIIYCECKEDSLHPGIYRTKFFNFPTEQGPGNIFVYSVFIDSKERVWFGTDGRGLTMYDHGKFVNFPSIDNDRGKIVYSIIEDRLGRIWFSTLNHGIYMYDGHQFRNFGISQGIRDLNIFGLAIDNAGEIVVAHQRGIDLINPITFQLNYIGEESGIETLDCNLNAIAGDDKGNTWIGTQRGLMRYYDYLNGDYKHPKTTIRRIYAFMKPLSGVSDSIFAYNQNQISIEYIGLWYSNPEAISYRYRLVGFSNEWLNTKDRIVTYPNLPPGTYQFQIVASANNEFRDPPITIYNFRVKKPLWKQSWFIFTLIFLGCITLVLFLRDRELRFRRIESLKKEKIEYQFETLKSQVNPHFLFNSFNTLISIIEDDRDRAVHYVEKLSDYFRNMVQYRDRDTIFLEDELELVNTYYYLQKQRFGSDLTVEITIPATWKKKYRIPPLSLQLLIENCVKHNAVSVETPLKISVEATDRESLLIRNNLNPKTNKDISTGIGLTNIINRFHFLTPKLVEVNKTETEFIVEVPLIPA